MTTPGVEPVEPLDSHQYRCVSDEDSRTSLWREVESAYHAGAHCDAHLMVPGGFVVPCHRLLLAAASPVLARALRLTTATEEERVAVVHVPDHDHAAVKEFVDGLYGFLARRLSEDEFAEVAAGVGAGLQTTLGIDLNALSLPRPLADVKVEDLVGGGGGGEHDSNLADADDFVKAELARGQLPVDVQIKERSRAGRRKGGKREAPGDSDEDWFAPPKRKKNRKRLAREEAEDDLLDEGDDYGDGEDLDFELPARQSARGGGKKSRPVKREPTLVERKPLPLRTEDGEEVVPSPEELYEQMSSGLGTFLIDLQDEPLNVPQHIRAKYRVRTVYQSMLGLVKTGDSCYDALPLAWSILGDSEDVVEQYRTTCRAFISVLGFSDMEAYYDAQVYSRQGIFRQNNNHKTRYALRKQYMRASRDELEALLRRDDVVAATQRRTPKPPFPVVAERATVILNPGLSVEQLEGIVFVAFFNDGEVTGHVLRVQETKRQEDTADCVKAAFEIWSRLKKDPKSKYFFMPKSPEMCRMYDAFINPCETFVVAQEFLRDVNGAARDKLLSKEKQCHECGLVFSLTNINEEQKFINHKRMHYIKNFQCECNVAFKNYPEKKMHFQLFHSDGKFVKCECCSFVANPAAVQRHYDKWHSDGATKEYICPTCGVTAKNKHGYYFHMMTHKEYTCETCGETIVGHKKLQQHRRRLHPQKPEEHPCGQCGKVYASERKLREHNFRMHVPDKDRPYPCPDCDRGFARSLELSQHRMQAHIRTRPYACRYGCGVAYNDYSSRGVHERKKHGAIFTAAVNTLQAMEAGTVPGIPGQ